MAKGKKKLGIGKAVAGLKDNVENNVTYIDDINKMKIVMLDANILKDYPDNKEIFGNLEGKEFDDLCESIKNRGVLQPVIVRPMEDEYEILAGHQRTRAIKANGDIKIPTIIMNVDDITARLIWLETNIRGRQLPQDKLANAINEAARLIDIQRQNGEIQVEGKTSKLLSQKFDMSPRTIEDLLMIARKVADGVKDLGLSKQSMKQISKLSKEEQEALVLLLGEDTIKELTSAEIEKTVQTMKLEMDNIDNTYKKVLEDTNKELGNTQDALKDKEKQLHSKENIFNKMREEVGELTHANVNIQRQIEEEKQKRIELEEQLKTAKAEDKETLKKEIAEKNKEVEIMLEQSTNFENQMKSLEEKMSQIQDEKQGLQKDLEAYEHNYKQLYEEKTKIIAENEKLKEKLEEASKPPKDYEEIKEELQRYKEKDNIDELLKSVLKNLTEVQFILSDIEKIQDEKQIDKKKQICCIIEELQKKTNNL